jgi:hypothetical protein
MAVFWKELLKKEATSGKLQAASFLGRLPQSAPSTYLKWLEKAKKAKEKRGKKGPILRFYRYLTHNPPIAHPYHSPITSLSKPTLLRAFSIAASLQPVVPSPCHPVRI